MNRATVFVVLVEAGAVALAVFAALYFASGTPMSGHYGWMMGQAGVGTGGSAPTMSDGAWAVLAVLLAVLFLGVGGLAYTLAYPEIRRISAGPPRVLEAGTEQGKSWEVLMRTSKAEERRVLEVLVAHGGSYLQKFVVKESGLSRLKTHRIVSRLAERGVVSVQRSGNTNEVSLAPWVKSEPARQDAVSSAA